MRSARLLSFALVVLAVWLGARPSATGPAVVPATLSAVDTAYSQNFDTLASSGTSSTVPTGWGFDETSTNANTIYTAGTGSSNAGDTYSFGAAGSTDRALGQLRSGALISAIGGAFTNTSAATFTNFDLSFVGEQWRAGAATRGAADRMDFQVSVDATSLTTGTWVDVDALDFSSPNISVAAAGALDGNAAANRKAVTATVTGLSIAPGATFWIRWVDFDISGSDDGLAIDDVTLTPHGNVVAPSLSGVGSATPSAVTAGDATVLTVTVTPAANPPSAGITVLADLSAIGGSSIQPFYDDGTHGDTTPGNNVFTFSTSVAAATTGGTKSLPVNISDGQSRTATATISITVSRPVTPIHDIQGDGAVSPLTGQVTTEGIITGVKSNGFFIQAPAPEYDTNPNTSEGIFVFTNTSGLAAAAPVVGNRVRVTGTISEFGTAGDPVGLSITELTSPAVTLLATGQILPPAITLTIADLFPGASHLQLERFESMRVHLDTVQSVTPTDGTVAEANATSTSTGLFFGVLPGTARPFREPGIQSPLPVPAEAPAGATPPVFDGNYEHIGVDTYSVFLNATQAAVTTPPAGASLEVTSGVTVTNITGPLDYTFRLYVVDAEQWNPPTATTPNLTLAPVSPRQDGEFSIASFNMERFFDTTNDPSTSDAVLTAQAFQGRLNKASLAIRNVLRLPDILGVEEVENLPTLQAIASKVNADAITAGQGDPQYQPFLVEGNDVGGIDVGLLVRADRVDLTPGAFTVTQYGKNTTFTEPGGGSALLNDRPALVLDGKIYNAPFEPYPITVIVNHLRSLTGIDGTDGERIRAKRRAQADDLAQLIRSFQTQGKHVVSVGDYNAFDVNDGYVDVIGIVRGAPAPANQVTVTTTLTPAQLPNPALLDALTFVQAGQRYSYVFDGNAQEIDHVLLTPELPVNRVEYGRMDADFPESYRGDFNRPERLSDHDPVVVFFNTPDIDTTAPVLTLPDDITIEGNATGGAIVTYSATAFDAVDGPVVPVCALPSGSLFPVGQSTVTCTATDLHGNHSTGSFTVTVTDTTPPAVTSTIATPPVLWPINKQLIPFAVIVTATDIVSGTQSRIVGITGDDDASAADWSVTGATSGAVRADRTGGGKGRTYTVTVETTDAAGNTTTTTAAVFVPHDQGKDGR